MEVTIESAQLARTDAKKVAKLRQTVSRSAASSCTNPDATIRNVGHDSSFVRVACLLERSVSFSGASPLGLHTTPREETPARWSGLLPEFERFGGGEIVCAVPGIVNRALGCTKNPELQTSDAVSRLNQHDSRQHDRGVNGRVRKLDFVSFRLSGSGWRVAFSRAAESLAA